MSVSNIIRNSRGDLANSRESRVKFLELFIQGHGQQNKTYIYKNQFSPIYTSEKKVKAIMKLSNYFLATTPKAQSIKEKNGEIRPHQKTLLRKWKR